MIGSAARLATVDSLASEPYRGLGFDSRVRTDLMTSGTKGWLRSKAHEYSNAIRAEPDRLSAHRRSANSPLQLAAGSSPRRDNSFFASTTPISSVMWRMQSARSWTAFAGSGSTGTKVRKSAGSFGPYFQSERSEHYREAAASLLESGHVYRDYSTDAERAAEKSAAEREKRRLPVSPEGAERLSGGSIRGGGTTLRPSVSGSAGTNARAARPDQGGRRVFDR